MSAAPVQAQKLAGPEFVAYPIDGDPVTGRLVAFTKPWKISLQVSERKAFDGADLVCLRRKEQPQFSGASGSQVLLANGDRIRASAHHADQEILKVNSELLGDVEIPLERVQALVLNPSPAPAARDSLHKRLAAAERKQDIVFLANGDELAGTFLGLDDSKVRLEGQRGATEINRTEVRAIALSSELISFPRPKELHAKIFLADGSELTVLEGWLDGGKFRGQAAFGREVAMSVEQVLSVEFRNGRLSYLSDLEPEEYRHTPYLDTGFPFQRDRTVLGNELTLRGQIFRKGLGVHSRSELTYRLDGQYRRFEAVAGIDDETGGQGSVVFRVSLDGKVAWESGLITGQSAPQRIRLDVSQAKQLTLVVDFGALGDVQDHADWSDARLVR